MASSKAAGRPAGPNYGRRIRWLGAIVLLVCVAYTAGWFFLAGKLKAEAVRAIAEANRGDAQFSCDNPVVRGFPFRIGIYCDRVTFLDGRSGVSGDAAGFRSAGQIYNPFLVAAELDAPAHATLPGRTPLIFGWDNLRASVRLASPLPERVSLELRKFVASEEADGAERPVATSEFAVFHARPNGDDLDLAYNFDRLALPTLQINGKGVEIFAGEGDVSVTKGAALLRSGKASLRSVAGTIRSLSLSLAENSGVVIAGPVSIDEAGLVDASLTLTIRDPVALSSFLSGVFPQYSQQIQTGLMGFIALGDSPSLPVRIVKGKASLGFIPLGVIPPL